MGAQTFIHYLIFGFLFVVERSMVAGRDMIPLF